MPGGFSFSGEIAHVVITPIDDGLIVAFRGTEPDKILDWLADIDFDTLDFYDSRVHRGFLHVHNEISTQLATYLMTHHSAKVYVTGHSLGGAVAEIFTSLCPFATALYTFGQPRTGNAKFHSMVKCEYFRIMNDGDIVPHVPPEMGNFTHGGRMVLLNNEGVNFIGTMPPIPFNLISGVEHHLLDSYLTRLK
jgi:triacylglycerol lipase